MKEINQRTNNEIIIRCNCGGQHLLSFDYWRSDEKWEDKAEKLKKTNKKNLWKDYTISFIDDIDVGLWYKVKQCWNYLFTRKGELCYSDICINSKDMKKIIKHFKKYMQL